MKKILMTSLVAMFTMTSVMAQVTVAEPEDAEETLMLVSDRKGVLLSQEKGTLNPNRSLEKITYKMSISKFLLLMKSVFRTYICSVCG